MARLSREFIKIETRLLNDYRFLALSEFEQLLFLKLLMLARITNNKIPNSNTQIELVLRTGRQSKELEKTIERLKEVFPKFKSNKHFHYFLGYNTRMNKYSPKRTNNNELDEDEDIDKDKEEDKEEKFIASLKNNNAFKQIDIARELGKMDAWLSTRPGRKKTRRFIVNWLNKIEEPIKPIRRTRPDE